MSDEKQQVGNNNNNNNNSQEDQVTSSLSTSTSITMMMARVPMPVKQRKSKQNATAAVTDQTQQSKDQKTTGSTTFTVGTMSLSEKMLFKNKLALSLSSSIKTSQQNNAADNLDSPSSSSSPGIKIEIRSPSLNIPLPGLTATTTTSSRNDVDSFHQTQLDQQETTTTQTPTDQPPPPPSIKPRAAPALARRKTLAESTTTSTTANVQEIEAVVKQSSSANNSTDQITNSSDTSNLNYNNSSSNNSSTSSSKQSIFNRALAFIPSFTSSSSSNESSNKNKPLPDIPPVYVKSENKSSVKLKKNSGNRLTREKRSNSIIMNSGDTTAATTTSTTTATVDESKPESSKTKLLLRTGSLDRFDSTSSTTNRSSSSSNRSSGFVDLEQPSEESKKEKQQRKSTDSKKLKKTSSTHKVAINSEENVSSSSSAVARTTLESVLLNSGGTTTATKSDETAYEKLENHFGSELMPKLICDNTSRMIRLNAVGGGRDVIEEQHRNRAQSIQRTDTSEDELSLKKRQKLDECSNIERKQAKLLTILYKNIYTKLNEENGTGQRLADAEDFQKLFYPVVELHKLAIMVHEQVSNELKSRIDEWSEKPYAGDILIKYHHYYKIYSCVLKRYPACQLTLSNLLKKKNFVASLKKYLDAEAEQLDNVNRLDMLLDRVVDFPRRCIQLYESYLKLVDFNSKEYENIKKVYTLFTQIFESSNSALDNMNNFQLCYELQYMFEPPLLNIVDQNRSLIKQGPVFKVAKRSGHFLLRHLALFTDMLLVCKTDRMRRKLVVNYLIQASEIRSVVISSDQEPLFRIVSNDQNNEFRADKMKQREEWIEAFRLVSGIRIDAKSEQTDLNKIRKIGIEPPPWVPDPLQEECSGCKESFSAFKRRHHCRTCGRIFCNACSNFYVPVQFTQFKEKVRVCRNCYNLLEKVYQDHLLNTVVVNNNVITDNNMITTTPSAASLSKTNNNNIISQSHSLISSHFPAGFNGVLKNITDTFSSGIGTSSAKTSTPSINVKFSKNNKRLTGIISDLNVVTQQSSTSTSGRKSESGGSTTSTTTTTECGTGAVTDSSSLCQELRLHEEDTSQSTASNHQHQAVVTFDASDDIESDDDDDDDDDNSSVDENLIGAESFRNPPSADIYHIKSPHSIDFGSVLSLENVNLNLTSSMGPNGNNNNEETSSINVSLSNSSHQIVAGGDDKSSVESSNISSSQNETSESITSGGSGSVVGIQQQQQRNNGLLTKSATTSLTSLLNLSRVSTSTTTKFGSSQSSRDVIHAEYGYLCKIQVKEEDVVVVEEAKKKWERTYLVLYSDHMIGSCQSNQDITKPNLLIKLSRYELKHIDETTFSLEVESSSSNSSSSSEQTSSSSPVATTVVANSQESSTNTSSVKIASFRNKRQMFEFNFEFKFNNKDSKNKWYQLLTSLKEQRDQ